MSDNAAEIYAMDHPDVPRKLRRRVEEEIMKELHGLVVAQDWPDYKYRLGIIQGLERARNLCAEIEEDM